MSASAREPNTGKFVEKKAGGSYGLSAELKRKQNAKYDYQMEDVIREWIEETTGKALPNEDFHLALKSGVVLCRLMNKLKSGSIKKISKKTGNFHQMNNISNFLTAARKRGIPEYSCFSTVDLFENKNMGQVLITLDCVRKKTGGRKMKVQKPQDKMGNLTGFDTSINKIAGKKRFDQVTGGNDAGAGRLNTTPMSSPAPASSGVRRASRNSAKRKSGDYSKKSEGYDGSFGLSAEVRAKMDAKYDYELEEVIQEWIEQTLNVEFEAPFGDTLQSGVVLCQLMNEVEGKHKRIPAKKVSKSSQKFSQMGNINLFLRACREFGLTEHSCFSTVDLHEQKNMMAVLVTLDSVRRGAKGRKGGIKKTQMASQFDPSIKVHKGTTKMDKINRNAHLSH